MYTCNLLSQTKMSQDATVLIKQKRFR